jgi:hypothetical protein
MMIVMSHVPYTREIRNVYRIFVTTPDGKNQLEGLCHRCGYNMNIKLLQYSRTVDNTMTMG